MAFDLHSRARSTLWLHRRQWARRIHLMKSRSIMSWVRRSCLARNDSGLPAETAVEGGGRRQIECRRHSIASPSDIVNKVEIYLLYSGTASSLCFLIWDWSAPDYFRLPRFTSAWMPGRDSCEAYDIDQRPGTAQMWNDRLDYANWIEVAMETVDQRLSALSVTLRTQWRSAECCRSTGQELDWKMAVTWSPS